MEKGLRRFSVPDLLVACCLLKPLTASEQCPNKTGLYHICEFLNSLKQMTGYFLKILQIVRCEEGPKTGSPISWFYFLVGVTPCLVNSRSARSLIPACSPMASLRMRSWQGSQILPLKVTSIFPQIIHFFFSSLMATILFLMERPCQVLIQHFDLFRILQDQLQSVSGMILDFSLQFNLFAFECLRLKLIFFEQVRS